MKGADYTAGLKQGFMNRMSRVDARLPRSSPSATSV